MLWLYQRVFFGPLREPGEHGAAGHGHAPAAAHTAHGHDSHGHAAHAHDSHGHDAHGHDSHGHGASDLPPSSVHDMNWREFWAVAPLVVLVFWVGLTPQTFLKPMQADIQKVTDKVDAAYRAHTWPEVEQKAVAAQQESNEQHLAAGTTGAALQTAAAAKSALNQPSAKTDKVEDLARVE